MAVTITDVNVLELLGRKGSTDVSLTTAKATATAVVDTYILDGTYPQATLDLIGDWFTAHLVSMSSHRERSRQRAGAGNSASFSASDQGFGLNETKYGRTVMLLDSKGIIIGIENGAGKGADGIGMFLA